MSSKSLTLLCSPCQFLLTDEIHQKQSQSRIHENLSSIFLNIMSKFQTQEQLFQQSIVNQKQKVSEIFRHYFQLFSQAKETSQKLLSFPKALKQKLLNHSENRQVFPNYWGIQPNKLEVLLNYLSLSGQ